MIIIGKLGIVLTCSTVTVVHACLINDSVSKSYLEKVLNNKQRNIPLYKNGKLALPSSDQSCEPCLALANQLVDSYTLAKKHIYLN